MQALLLALILLPQAGAAPVLAAQAPSANAANDALCAQIEALIESPDAARAHWGVSVTQTDGTPLCSLHALKLFRPASTNKIFTSAAALALLGPDKTFATSVIAEGALKNGALTGNLLLRGGGDANFGAEDVPYLPPAEKPAAPAPPPLPSPTIADVEDLADQIVARGVRSITGDIVGDDTYFAWQPYPPEWSAGDLLYGYGAPVSALSIHDNQVRLHVAQTPPATTLATAQVTAEISPAVPWFTLTNTAVPGQARVSCGAQLVIERDPGSLSLTVAGAVPPGDRGCAASLAIADPAEYAAIALQQALERRGVRINGKARADHWDARQPGGVFTGESDADDFLKADLSAPSPQPVACSAPEALPYAPPHGAVLATHVSPPLIADEIYTLKTSQNLHAELLLRNLGAAFSCDRTQRGSLHVLREFLLHAGVAPDDFVLYDGSGLSSHDLVAPRAFTTFLTYAMHQPWFAQWRTALPIGGIDGTLHSRFRTTLKGRVFAKTGTLGESSALAGYVLTSSGQTRIFAIMVDNHTPMNSAHHVVVDNIVEAIAGGAVATPE